MMERSNLGPACLSDYRLDALIVGELGGEDRRAADDHLSTCESCKQRLEQFRTSYAETREKLPPLPQKARPSTSRRDWMGVAGAGLALAAAVALFVRSRAPDEVVDTTRLKGNDKVVFYIEHEGRIRNGYFGEHVVPGDKLQFAYSARRPVRALVLSLDGAKKTSVYADGATEMPATTGNEVRPLPTSVVLDETLGEEHLWSLLCDSHQDAFKLRERLSREQERFLEPGGCSSSHWVIVKEARTP